MSITSSHHNSLHSTINRSFNPTSAQSHFSVVPKSKKTTLKTTGISVDTLPKLNSQEKFSHLKLFDTHYLSMK